MDSQDSLIKKSEAGSAFEGLKNHYGYKELVALLQQMYIEAYEKLENSDDIEARAIIKVLKDIVLKIDDTINLGKQAREELREGLFAKHIEGIG